MTYVVNASFISKFILIFTICLVLNQNMIELLFFYRETDVFQIGNQPTIRKV